MKNINYGGDISNISGLEHILSIGYEVECGILMKLTRSETGDSSKHSKSSKGSKSLEKSNSLKGSEKGSESWGLGKLFEGGNSSEIKSSSTSSHSLKSSKSSKSSHSLKTSNPNKIVLFNSDTFAQDILEFKKFDENPEDIDENIIARLEEMVEDKIYDDNNQIDTNSAFYITNDIALSPFMKELTAVCHYPSEEDIKSHSVTIPDIDHSDEKNNLYLFRDTEKNQDYEINFLFKDAKVDCATHSNVEWVFTYYRPQQSGNIIINTFLNMIKNLLRHLSDLQPITGNFIMKYKDEQGKDSELIIAKPQQRVLYHKPNTNLYYLLTQMVDSPFTIDDACSVFQMTFSSKCEHIMEVMVALLTDTLKSIPSFSTYIDSKLEILLTVQRCVDNLIDNYNNSDSEYKIHAGVETVKNYLCLILLKLKIYYEFKNAAKKPKYLKNLLFFNSRHSNYVLYTALKSKIEQLLNVDTSVAIDIIKRIVFQPDILKQINSPNIKIRKGAFSISNTLEKSNKNYGDPVYSLVSYFDFFESPVDDDTNIDDDDEIINYDWLEYKKFDDYSAKMELKDDIILVECRIFQKLLSSYVYSIADEELKQQMTNGACNILTNNYGPDVSSLSIANLKKIIELHGSSNLGLGLKTRKTRKTTLKVCPNNKKLNPKTNRCIRKCHEGETRNKKNRCVRKTSKNRRTKITRKNIKHRFNKIGGNRACLDALRVKYGDVFWTGGITIQQIYDDALNIRNPDIIQLIRQVRERIPIIKNRFASVNSGPNRAELSRLICVELKNITDALGEERSRNIFRTTLRYQGHGGLVLCDYNSPNYNFLLEYLDCLINIMEFSLLQAPAPGPAQIIEAPELGIPAPGVPNFEAPAPGGPGWIAQEPGAQVELPAPGGPGWVQ